MKLRPRLSLLNLLLVVAIVALTITVGRFQRQAGWLKSQVAGYEAELGYLDTTVEQALNVVRVETATSAEVREYQWRFMTPPGSEVSLVVADGSVPLNGYPKTRQLAISLLPDFEYVATLVGKPAEDPGEWVFELRLRRGDGRLDVHPIEVGEGLGSDFEALDSVLYKTEGFPVDRPTPLVRLRTPKVAVDPAPGILIWFQPRP